eukprot:3953542-Amphidinium_carterae.1
MVLGWSERDFMRVLHGLWSVLRNTSALERLGIAHSELLRGRLRAEPAHAEFNLNKQDEHTQVLVGLVQRLVSTRACSYLQYAEGMPHCLLRLLSADEGT